MMGCCLYAFLFSRRGLGGGDGRADGGGRREWRAERIENARVE